MSQYALKIFESSPVVSFCLPVAASRYLLHHSAESRLSRLGHALLVLAIAIPNRLWWFVHPDDDLLFSPLIAVLLATFAHASLRPKLGLPRNAQPLWGVLVAALSIAVGITVTAAAHFFFFFTLRLSAAAAAAWGVKTLVQPAVASRGIDYGHFVAAAVFGVLAFSSVLDAAAEFLFPTRELKDALMVVRAAAASPRRAASSEDAEAMELSRVALELVFLTVCIQLSMGFIGIDYLRSEQTRKLSLLSIAPSPASSSAPSSSGSSSKESKAHEASEDLSPPRTTSRTFLAKSARFVVFTALPFMLWRGSLETVNTLAFAKLQQRVEADFLSTLFQAQGPTIIPPGTALHHEQHGNFGAAAAAALVAVPSPSTARLRSVAASNFTVSSYSESLADITKTAFTLFSRKCFSVPKMALFPGLFLSRPGFVASVLPISVGMDMAKAWLSSSLTLKARELRKQASALKSEQQRIQEHDIRHEQQIRLNHATAFTRDRWVATAQGIKAREAEAAMLESLRGYLNWLYWSDVLKVGIEVMLAALLESGSMAPSDVLVSSRVVEDAIDTLLMRFRAEADLATLATDEAKLRSLLFPPPPPSSFTSPPDAAQSGRALKEDEAAAAEEEANTAKVVTHQLVPCTVSPGALKVNGLAFQRGHASVRMDGVLLPANGDIVAVTGANGCGKSSSFAVFAAGACTERPVELPESLALTSTPTPQPPLLGTPPPEAAVAESRAGGAPAFELSYPGTNVVTVSQVSYFPLFSRPIDWFLASDDNNFQQSSSLSSSSSSSSLCPSSEAGGSVCPATTTTTTTSRAESGEGDSLRGAQTTEAAEAEAAARVAELANELEFFQQDDSTALNASTLLARADDWYGSLSGGQRSKADFIRQVFSPRLLLLTEGSSSSSSGELGGGGKCPALVLIDEGFAALDPRSKALVQAKLKAFCSQSVVLVIYHTDSSSNERPSGGGGAVEDERSSARIDESCINPGFFDANLHFQDGVARLRPMCPSQRERDSRVTEEA